MKNKKAISPLIATVLIIGFTIVLAAVVIQWGGQLVEKLKGQTDVSIELSDACQKFSALSVNKITLTATGADVAVDNKNDQEASGFVFRAYLSDSSITPTTLEGATDNLPAFGVKTYPIVFTGTLNQVGVVPAVTLSDNKVHTCSSQEIKATYTAP